MTDAKPKPGDLFDAKSYDGAEKRADHRALDKYTYLLRISLHC
jgi:hypothetical protein